MTRAPQWEMGSGLPRGFGQHRIELPPIEMPALTVRIENEVSFGTIRHRPRPKGHRGRADVPQQGMD